MKRTVLKIAVCGLAGLTVSGCAIPSFSTPEAKPPVQAVELLHDRLRRLGLLEGEFGVTVEFATQLDDMIEDAPGCLEGAHG